MRPSCRESTASIGIQPKGAVPMEKSGSKSLHLQGRIQKDHHLTISGCRNGHGPGLNGEPYALKGARTVRGGEALMRFLLHCQPVKAGSTWRPCSIFAPCLLYTSPSPRD